MYIPRRAAPAPPALAAALRLAVTALAGALSVVLALLGLVSLRMAHKVVTPARRVPNATLVEVDTAAQTVTLERTPDTVLPGRYGLFTEGTESYVKIGAVLSETEQSVSRKLLTHVGARTRLSAAAGFSGWYYDRPEQLHLPFDVELIGSAVGPCPAWVFPAEHESDIWAIQIHGRGSTRAEGLRAVPVFRELGITSMLVSYRNDGEAPRSRSGTYGLGATEWRDVDAAVGYARRRGARRIVLMGWSMGGAIALQLALNSVHRDLISAIVLDSPVLDWRVVVDYQARLNDVPPLVAKVAMLALGSEMATPLTRTGGAIPFDRLDVVARARELTHPILILHSDDDGFVPSDASHDLVVARPDLVRLEVFEVARHAKLWNYDQTRWTGAIQTWLEHQGLSEKGEASDS